jgi:hypothetical protein
MGTIDARDRKERDILLQLRDVFRQNEEGTALCVNLLLSDKTLVKKIRAYAKMSGYESEYEDRDGYFEIRIYGTSCRCG